MELLRLILLDVFRLTSALAGFWLVCDWIKVRRLRLIGMPLVFEDPALVARKWAQIGLFGVVAGIAVYLRDRTEAFAPGSMLGETALLLAWACICMTMVERSARRAPRVRLAGYAYAAFMVSVLAVAIVQRG